MSYRLRITKQQLGDFIIMILFDKFFDEELLQENEKFNEIFQKMESLGLKGKVFQAFFDVDPIVRSKYKTFRRNFDEDNTVSIVMSDVVEEDENRDYKDIIFESIKRITGKENPDPKKVQKFTNTLINDMMYINEEEIQ